MGNGRALPDEKIEFLSSYLKLPKFLKLCRAYGYEHVVIGPVNHPNIPHIKEWINRGVYYFVMASGPGDPRGKKSSGKNWPAIWEICEQLNIKGGSANGHECAIQHLKLQPGAYSLVNRRWKKLDLPVIDTWKHYADTGERLIIT